MTDNVIYYGPYKDLKKNDLILSSNGCSFQYQNTTRNGMVFILKKKKDSVIKKLLKVGRYFDYDNIYYDKVYYQYLPGMVLYSAREILEDPNADDKMYFGIMM